MTPATKQQMIELRDLMLEHGDNDAAAAIDNAIDVLMRSANPPSTKRILKAVEEPPTKPSKNLGRKALDEVKETVRLEELPQLFDKCPNGHRVGNVVGCIASRCYAVPHTSFDPRSPAQIERDEWELETLETRHSDEPR